MSDNQIDLKEVTNAIKATNVAFEAFKEADKERDAEIKRFGEELPETKAKLEKIEADLTKFQAVADEAVLAAKRASRVVVGADGQEVDMEAKAASFGRAVTSASGRQTAFSVEQMEATKAAFDPYLRKGLDGMDADERKALSVGGDPNGGYVVHPDMSGRIVAKNFETSPMRAYAAIQVISTDALEGLYDNDEAGAEWEVETQTPAETATPDLGKYRIDVHELRARPKATQKILDDAEIDIEGWLADKIASRFARKEAQAFVIGDGNTKPRGFLTYPDGTDLTNSVERFQTGANGQLPAAPNGGDVLIDALYGLKAVYRANAVWFMNRATTSQVRKLKDSDGSYIWSPGIAAGQPATLLGYPVAAFEDMPNPATGSLSIAVGDMRQAYQIVDRIGIRTLRDPYTAKPFVEFYTTKRVGGDMINGEALKLIEFSA